VYSGHEQQTGVIEAWPPTDVSVDELLAGLRGEQDEGGDDRTGAGPGT